MEDLFKYIDNFKKTEDILSDCIFANHSVDIPLITIGIPTYKRSQTLIESLESAIEQHYDGSYEIIVLDNNPERNDETEIVMTKYKSTPTVCYYKNTKNLGMGGNWNRIFTLARSKWVVLLHDDDIIAPCFLSDMISVATTFKADVVNSAFLIWQESISKKPDFSFPKKKYSVCKSTLAANQFVHFAGMPSGIIYKRDIYINEGGVNTDYFPSLDYVFHAKLSYKYNFLLYNKKLTIYRRSVNESSNYETIKKYVPQDYCIRKFIGNLLNYPDFFVEHTSLYYCRSRLNNLPESEMFVKEISNSPIRKLNCFSSLILDIYIHMIIRFYNLRNKIGYF